MPDPSLFTVKSILAHLGYRYPDLDPLFAGGGAERHDLQDEREMFRRLVSGERYDAAVLSKQVGRWLIRKEGWEGRFVTEPIETSEVAYRLMLGPGEEGLMTLFNEGGQRLHQSGELDAILNRYGGSSLRDAKWDARAQR